MNRKSFILFILLFGLCSVCYGQVGKTTHTLDGSVAIGSDTTIAGKLIIGGGASAGAYALQVAGDSYFSKSTNGPISNVTLNTNAGNLVRAGMEFTTDGGTTYLYRTSNAYATAADQNDTVLADQGGGDIVIQSVTEVARFKNGGGMDLVGTIGIGGSVYASAWVGGAVNATIDSNGYLVRDPSDSKLKRNVVTVDKALAKVLKLRGVYFDWVEGSNMGDQRSLGLIAQEVEKVIPEAVSNGPDYKSVGYTNLTAVTIEAIKELNAKVEKQDAVIRALVKRLSALEKK